MIYLKTDEEIELMREANQLVGKTLGELAKHIKPGVTTLQLDTIAETFIRDHGAVPAFLGYGGFPNSICASVNEQVVHGIPSDKVILKEGDIISVDCGTVLNGFVGDSAYTFCVGEVSEETKRLLRTTKESLYKGIEQAVAGKRVGDVSNAVQTYCESRNYSVVRELVGHGCGRKMHEDPEVPNFGRRGCGALLKNGMCICIEPMINQGSKNVLFESDGWTVRTKDRKCSAHFEHCVAIRPDGPQILSSFDYLEQIVGKEF
ncbi:MAG: type I methionyl aminopeptidase [Tannerella sp.]|jgi:methionyl aminopeptidase|nr:type I methionyl aminopeptidase [Tannerella sp.]